MTDTITVTLTDELDRLNRELDRLVDRLADADPGAEGTQLITREARDIDQAGQAVARLIDTFDADAEVTYRALTAGDYARVEDRVADMRAVKRGPGGVPGSSRNVFVAAGLVDAPFLNGADPEDLDAKLAAVADQPPGVVKWLEDVISEHSGGGSGNSEWTPLARRLQETAGD